MIEIFCENLSCPKCDRPHVDSDAWALDPHKKHLCLYCGELFQGSIRGVSHPAFDELSKPEDVQFVTYKFSCKDYLRQALEALQTAQNHQDWDRYSVKTYYAVDLNLEDALTVLQAAIADGL